LFGNEKVKGDFGVKYKYSWFMIAVFIVLGCFANAYGVVEWDIRKTFKLEKPPLDVAVAVNGKWVFVLAEGGKLLIYSADGTLKDHIMVESHVDGIAAGAREDVLFLSSRKGAIVQEIELDFVYDINTAGAPFKGPEDAPVVIAVFNDYQ
jgi:hypothetical protein